MGDALKSRLIPILEKVFSSTDRKNTLYKYIENFLHDYEKILCGQNKDLSFYENLTNTYLREIKECINTPFQFPLFHKAIHNEIDFSKLGNDFFSPIIDKNKSAIFGRENLIEIDQAIKKKENVILLSNHQIEADPQVISIMIEPITKALSKNMIFVAGFRVITDPLSVPFTKGRNIFCIYSKNYYDIFPEEKSSMQEHNKKTIFTIRTQLNQGGNCIYIAPSGGRDRRDSNGSLTPTLFDEKSVDLFCLLASRSTVKTHIYPLSLKTYDLMPPPKTRRSKIGEERRVFYKPTFLYFGKKIDPQLIQEFGKSKKGREKRCAMIYNIVRENYINGEIKSP